MLTAEEFLLLALDDESGKISYSGASSFPFGIVGGLLLDLMLHERINVKEKLVQVVDPTSTGDPLLDDVLKKIGDMKRSLRLRSWIIQLSVSFRNVYSKGLLSRLTDQGMLGREEKPRLKIFHAMRHPLVQPEKKNQLLEKIQGIILDNQDADIYDLGLLCLIRECGLIGSLFLRDFRTKADARIEELLHSTKLPSNMRGNITEMNVALAGILYQPPYPTPRRKPSRTPKKKEQ